MTDADRSSRTLLAALAGYATVVLVTTAGTTAAAGFGLPLDGPPTTTALAINIAVTFAAAIAGGYLAARLAPTGRAVMTLGLLMLALLAMAVAASRFWPDTRQPPSYLPLVTLLSVIGVWTGGMIERAVHGSGSRTSEHRSSGTREPT
jgi:hypothetical protein